MSTLIRILAGHMRFVPAHRQSDDLTATLSPAMCPVEFVLIAYAAGHAKYLDQSRIQGILAPAIYNVCRMTSEQTNVFPYEDTTRNGTLPHPRRHLTRPIPRCPVTLPATGLIAPNTPPRDHNAGPHSTYIPNLGRVRSRRLPRNPLRIVELCGGLAIDLEALLKVGYTVNSYAWVDIDLDVHAAISRRIAHLRLQYPYLFPLKANKDWDSRLSTDVRTISPELLTVTFPKGIDLLLASPPMLARHLPRSHRVHTLMEPDVVRHILHFILYLSEAPPEGVGYLWNSYKLHSPFATTLSILDQGTLIDASKCGSGAYRNTRIWQNLLPHDTLAVEHARLQPLARPVEASILETTGLSM